jgi:hypothetical protein
MGHGGESSILDCSGRLAPPRLRPAGAATAKPFYEADATPLELPLIGLTKDSPKA